jgi:3'(2'), 5'-bisphosphate nucleotidase
LRRLAVEAGAAIMEVYAAGDFEVRAKADDSPVTEADLAADRIICAGSGKGFPRHPVVTEERAESHASPPDRRTFLVDPLDGTKEFIQRRGEFTVNIALIEAGAAVAGVVYAPAIGRLFRTERVAALSRRPVGSIRCAKARRAPSPRRAGRPAVVALEIPPRCRDGRLYRRATRSLASSSAGSSLKFCLVAAGEAHLYPRLGRTMEWDTGAGQAVLGAAGGSVIRFDDHAPLRYGKPGRANPFFVAHAPGVVVLPPA